MHFDVDNVFYSLNSHQYVSAAIAATFSVINFTFMLPCVVIDLFLNSQPEALIISILFCYKTLRISGIFSAHH